LKETTYSKCPDCQLARKPSSIIKAGAKRGLGEHEAIEAFERECCEAIGEQHFGDPSEWAARRDRAEGRTPTPPVPLVPPADVQQWEYRVEVFKNPRGAFTSDMFAGTRGNHPILHDELNRLGAEGWELVSVSTTVKTVVSNPNELVCIFKRPVVPVSFVQGDGEA
jgi:hypothetical protein